MQVELRTPEATLFEGEASAVSLPGSEGRFQVLNRHAPLLSTLEAGTLRLRSEKQELQFRIGVGLAEVKGDRLRVLVESAVQK